MPKITPFLWFDNNAEQAAGFYLSIFPSARKLEELRAAVDTGTVKPGGLLTITIELEGQQVVFLNGGPYQKLSPAFSFFVSCKTQSEIDGYWAKLLDGGQESQCGWLTDKFGVSWQIVPENIMELVSTPAAMNAMMQMVKLDIATLEAAAKQ